MSSFADRSQLPPLRLATPPAAARPANERWPMAVAAPVILGLSLAGWFAVWHLGAWLLRLIG
jgi:hypothetical protein